MLQRDTSNLQFQLAADFINQTCQPVFLTGKAGTGKTTFLKYIKENTLKSTVIVAPTGVAAINAGGTTIHSFFQLPFGPFLPTAASRGFGPEHHNSDNSTDKNSLLSRLRIQKDKRELFQQLDLLIIDEISMVRSDTLDAIDTILRHFRHNQHQPFGGVQLLFIGDLFQLPPVMPSEEWSLLQDHYQSPFFFDSHVLKLNPPLYIELEKIYRQNEQSFIEVLNKVRNNCLDENALELLHTRYDPGFEAPYGENYILLTTHNVKADMVNTAELQKLKEKTHSFEAVITGDFNEKSFPAEKSLQVKVGAQVMFIKNDVEKIRRYFNGKIGVITKIEEGEIYVQCNDAEESIKVEQELWRNIRYSLNKEKQKVEEEEVGSFKQYPLRLAWAITIHKSQGLTFEKAIIDAGAAFAAGQVYVALSRCTSLKGLVLRSRINASSVFSDQRVVSFATQTAAGEKLEPLLQDAKHSYQAGLIKSLFDIAAILSNANALQRLLKSEAASFNPEAQPWAEQLVDMSKSLQQVAIKFQVQLQQLLLDPEMPDANLALQQRISAASQYFIKTIEEGILANLKKLIPRTDSRPKAQLYRDEANDLYKSIVEKLRQLQRCKEGFSMEKWNEKKTDQYSNDLPFNYFQGQDYSSETQHPELYQQLKDLRNEICKADDLPIYLVASSATLNELTQYLPLTKEELSKINGFGKIKSEKYGPRFLEIIQSYCDQFGLESQIHEKIIVRSKKEKKKEEKIKDEKIVSKEVKKPTRLESYELFKSGKTIAEIAEIRNLVTGTIENHLSSFIVTGELDVFELIAEDKLNNVLKVLRESGVQAITTIKEKLGDDFSYSDIRVALAYQQWLARDEVV